MAKVKEDKRRRWGARSLMGAGAALLVVAAAAAGCGSGSSASTGSSSGKIQVAAAENFWGSIASQLGGNKVAVTSIITNPDTDPHTYQPTASDGRAIAAAQMVMYNGIGYDPWAPKLVAANSGSHPTVLNV
ncbi:MAG TPA: zinc ABC transporter substrate-binding protein, partial [Acidimicrobiales bacterium]|nr:zinc ABC transporter substrate-binding protein [Acidimicrobiales bacterium]